MISNIFIGVGILLIICFLGHLQVSISPFFIKLPAWRMAFGCILVMMGVIFIIIDSDRRATEKIRNELEEEIRKLKSETLRES